MGPQSQAGMSEERWIVVTVVVAHCPLIFVSWRIGLLVASLSAVSDVPVGRSEKKAAVRKQKAMNAKRSWPWAESDGICREIRNVKLGVQKDAGHRPPRTAESSTLPSYRCGNQILLDQVHSTGSQDTRCHSAPLRRPDGVV